MILGVGIDLVDMARAARLLARKGDFAVTKLLTEDEQAYLRSRPDPAPHFAARLAAKEAVYKALQHLPGYRGVGWQDIEVRRDGDGRPTVRLHGLAARLVTEQAGTVEIHLSLTHTDATAAAVAIVELRS